MLSACQFGEDSEAFIIEGDSPIVYIKQPQSSIPNSVDDNVANLGSDLYFRDVSSSESKEINLTSVLTNGKGSVADPEVSFDGKRIVFSMLCTSDSSDRCNGDRSWNIWVYEIETNSFYRVIADFETANAANDIDPAFLPDGKIVFSSTRQQSIRERFGFAYSDKYSRKESSVLHVMQADGTRIEQISFNTGSDFNPTVLQNGKIMFSRREYVGDHLQMAIYTANPDGSAMDVLYGAHSPGEVFSQPRELENGKLIASVIPFEGTWGGGALLEIDSHNYSDYLSPGPAVRNKNKSGQVSATVQDIPLEKEVSKLGRFTTPYPLRDGSNRVLVGFSFFQKLEETDDVFLLSNSISYEEAPPEYGIYSLNMDDKSLKPLIREENETAMTNPVAIYPRENVPVIPRREKSEFTGIIGSQVEGIINVKSVYDTDQFGRMGQGVLTANEVTQVPIPLIVPDVNSGDTRAHVADIEKIKDPFLTRANQRPARFLRVSTSVPVPKELDEIVLGISSFEMRRLVGYAPIEPDGSVKVKVPADIALIISVLDSEGRAFEKHNNRIQVRPGETLTCNGCHSPQRSLPLNRSPIAGSHENTMLKYSNGLASGGVALENETMAETRTRIDPQALTLTSNIEYRDVWTDTSFNVENPSISFKYENLQTKQPINGEIHYIDHIQPIWNYPRGSNTCINCHDGVNNEVTNPTRLSLNGNLGSGTRVLSYTNLLTGRILFDEDGIALYETIGDKSVLRRSLPLVNAGFARGSFLIEKLYGKELFAEKILPVDGLDHSSFLSRDEKRLIAEWIDNGAQYYNTPFDENNELRILEPSVSYIDFVNTFYSQIRSTCSICHAQLTVNGEANGSFEPTAFNISREAEADYILMTTMISNTGNPTDSDLLARPSGIRDDEHINPSTKQPLIPIGTPLYNTIRDWIAGF